MLPREAAPLRVKAVNALRSKIVAGEYGPRVRLTEKNLEEDLGVSRTVVREALRQLESEQLISIEPNIGPSVRELTFDDVVNLYQVRGVLEGAAGGLAAQITPNNSLSSAEFLMSSLNAPPISVCASSSS